MKEKFIFPEAEVIKFEANSFITLSKIETPEDEF